MRVTKEQIRLRPLCKICGAPVSSRRCDRAVFGARNPTHVVAFESKETGRTSEETEEEQIEKRLRAKGIII